MIVLAPDGRIGAFLYEYAADETESPFYELDYSFADLLSHYADYIRFPKDSPERRDSPVLLLSEKNFPGAVSRTLGASQVDGCVFI
jgi:hypothetical protein